MSLQPVKFYQTGTFTVGNRLLAPEERSVQANMERTNSLNSGHRACQGCGEALGARYAIDAAMIASQGQLVAANATGCLEVFSTPYPETSWQIPWIHSLFGNTAAVATGIAAAIKVKKAKGQGGDVRVVAQGGDGGTTDIGFGCLSGMFERNDDVLYICYDNGGYMNTGVQRSSATPPAARTATTMPVGPEPGNAFGQGKFMPALAMAHEIPYVATATVADLRDLEYKVKKAMTFRGARYIQILVPCPLGWGAASQDTIRLSRLAKETGTFPVFEAEYGEITSSSKIRRLLPVEEYLRPQKRFAHLFGKVPAVETIARLQALADRNIRRYQMLDKEAN
ncbi:MAG: pyruvate ferredoxin oxidoreductase [Propionivibrio sp.]|uniref:thiamine pyrophosphate-dependent enzyme n=1 Tax=Propionivibrio sp. TaxID=2212460 RepID=UPI001A555C80|nr:thiamine pyrophosphate-dependent enzyme [Propionivibrio sp.]MBL8415222.1 pyruvate ferredoxin oxidoreductase [Propionivibrio sp.]